MFSKSFVTVVIVLGFVSAGCSKWLHEDPPANTAIEFDKNKTRCLRDWSNIMDRYLLGSSSRAEIEDFWNCLDGVVLYFQKHFPGDDKGIYPIDTLKTLVEDLFLDRKIPDSLTERFKDLKKAIFSGDRETFSQDDLSRLHLILGEFKYGTSKMLAHMKIINFSSNSDVGLDAAIADIEEVATHWTKTISSIHQSYKLKDLIRFWSELKQLIGIKVFQLDEERWEDLLKIAERVKSLILGAPGDQILQGDWPLLYQRSADAYIISLLYHYRLRGKKWTDATSVYSLKKATDLIFRGVKESVRRHPNERISAQEFVDLALIAKNEGWINAPRVRDASLRTAISNLFGSFFQDATTKGDSKQTYLTLQGMTFVESELGRWLVVQAALNKVFAGTQKISRHDFSGKWAAVGTHFPATEWPNMSEVSASLDEFKDVLNNNPYLNIDHDGQVLFSKAAKVRNSVSMEAVSHLNWMTRVTRLIFHGYGDLRNGILEKSFDLFYRDFREIGVDLGFLNAKAFDSGVRAFLEANTFTESANGDAHIGKLEAVQELQILLSGGIGASTIIDGVLKICETRQQNCVRGSDHDLQLAANVVEQYLNEKYHIIFSNLPNMVAEFDAMVPGERQRFFSLLLRESQKDFNGRTLTVSQIRYVVGILHFAESIVLRYDDDMSNIIDAVEVQSAFKVFQGFLEQAIWKAKGERVDPNDLFVGFAYFLKYGESIVQGGGMWAKIQTAVYYLKMQRELSINNYRLRRSEIVRAMLLFRNFASGS